MAMEQQALEAKIRELPPRLRQEIAVFVESLVDNETQKAEVSLKLNWRGALKELSNQYTSVELQHKALEWW
jgi:galactose-1-phosphate uridylyltransferase